MAAVRTEATGTTRVTFVVEPSGQVSAVSVERRSGETRAHVRLDRAAVEAVTACRFAAVQGYGPRRAAREFKWEIR